MSESKTSVVTALPASADSSGFVRGLGLFDSTTIVVGSMIGSGIFIVSADIARNTGSTGGLLAGLDHHRPDDRYRGAFLRRACGHDAKGRRAIRLPARSVFSALGIFVRLDAFPRDSDRNDRRGGRGLCAISRRRVARDFSEHLDRSSDRALRKICDQPFRAATRGAAADSVSDRAQYAGIEAREADSKCFHFGENAGRLPR